MATIEEVEQAIADLIGRLDRVDNSYRAMLPTRRLIQTTCPDLDTTWHATWASGRLEPIQQGRPERRPDIRIKVDSNDLMALAGGELDFARAYAEGRIRVDASMTDLLRLRASL